MDLKKDVFIKLDAHPESCNAVVGLYSEWYFDPISKFTNARLYGDTHRLMGIDSFDLIGLVMVGWLSSVFGVECGILSLGSVVVCAFVESMLFWVFVVNGVDACVSSFSLKLLCHLSGVRCTL